MNTLSETEQQLYDELVAELFNREEVEETVGEMKRRIFSKYTWEDVAGVQVYLTNQLDKS